METLRELFAKGDFHSLISYGRRGINSCLPEEQHLFYGAIGRAHLELGELTEAIAALDEAIALNPRYAIGLRNRDLVYLEQGEYQLAVTDFEMAIGAGPHFDTHRFLGYAYARLKQHEHAIAAYSAHLDVVFDVWALSLRADSLIALRRFVQARNDWERILASHLTDQQHLLDITSANCTQENATPISRSHDGNKTIPQLLAAEGFASIDEVSRRNSALLGSGVYVLAFSGGDYYVGQTVAPVTRLQTHLRSNDDLTGIWFKPTPADALTVTETASIALFETKSLRVRNLKQVSFSNLFATARQHLWITDNMYNHVTGERFRDEAMRKKYQARFEKLQQKAYYPFLITFLADYIKKTIPNYVASEYTYWSVSCLPQYLLSSKCITRVNINEVPVLSIFEDKAGKLSIALFASKLPFLSALEETGSSHNTFDNLATMYFQCNDSFEKAAPDEIAVYCEQEDFVKILENEVLLSSIRWFNLRMMNNVGKEEASRRTPSHCLPLADLLLH